MQWLTHKLKVLGYASTYSPTVFLHTKTLDEHAAELAAEIQSRLNDAVTKIDIVTYSMGGLLLRSLLNHINPDIIGGIVMIAPPNKGAEMAAFVRRILPIHHLGWDPLLQLLPNHPDELPEPPVSIPVLVIAGVKGDGKGYMPFLSEDNDGKVCIRETRMNRLHQHKVVKGRHYMLIIMSSTIELVRNFLAASN